MLRTYTNRIVIQKVATYIDAISQNIEATVDAFPTIFNTVASTFVWFYTKRDSLPRFLQEVWATIHTLLSSKIVWTDSQNSVIKLCRRDHGHCWILLGDGKVNLLVETVRYEKFFQVSFAYFQSHYCRYIYYNAGSEFCGSSDSIKPPLVGSGKKFSFHNTITPHLPHRYRQAVWPCIRQDRKFQTLFFN